MNSNIAFRVDASDHIGTGHFMRCLTLAEMLKNRGNHIFFFSRNLPLNLSNMLDEKGMTYLPLNIKNEQSSIDELAHAAWLGVSQLQDAEATIQALDRTIKQQKKCWDWLIVDHYALDTRWESVLRSNTKQLMVIDDLADRNHNCDFLLDQNYYLDSQVRYKKKVPMQCRLLLGPNFALLREEFKNLRRKIKIRTGEIKKILVFFGGVDIYNYTGLAIKALAEMDVPFHVDVVIGEQHPCKNHIQNECVKYNFFCHVQTSHIAHFMAKADFGIGAGGTSSWERCCLALPSLVVAIADNQVQISKALDSIGACFYVEIKEKLTPEILKRKIVNLMNNPDQLSNTSKNAFAVTDGDGAFRVISEMGF
ncbi:UDP-2,4-diacetamido-2,4,6-trideoxy-beta-L-altropyranose hydrolase [Candidatus Methylopumilus planktonicus]|uniref:UDP-2,4-diacetamido-2,4, 6-trideoxy-beta-L-altropyranose hydrolase n=1 Tax=Candidatus Methylopumilus planktonicus TaxID=1581557 RepID=UPI003D18798A